MEEVLGREGVDVKILAFLRTSGFWGKEKVVWRKAGEGQSRFGGGALYTPSSKANELEVSSAVA
jgi:hypothetical protein